MHYNAEPIDGSNVLNRGYIPVTTYRPVFSSTTPTPSSPIPTSTVLPPIGSSSTPAYLSSPITTPQPPIAVSSPITVPSKYFELPQYNANDDSPIIRIKPYTLQSTPIAAYTIDQINNELRQPNPSPISLDDVGPSAPFTPIVVTSPTSFGDRSSTISPISSTDAAVESQYNRRLPFNRGGVVDKRPIAYYGPNQWDISGNGIDELRKYDRYNARTPNGFGYFLPRHYHEETYREVNANANARDGSFGYIDPFGIRRVIYYHASPDGGFKVRKNNRYVGFNAKPYDSKK